MHAASRNLTQSHVGAFRRLARDQMDSGCISQVREEKHRNFKEKPSLPAHTGEASSGFRRCSAPGPDRGERCTLLQLLCTFHCLHARRLRGASQFCSTVAAVLRENAHGGQRIGRQVVRQPVQEHRPADTHTARTGSRAERPKPCAGGRRGMGICGKNAKYTVRVRDSR